MSALSAASQALHHTAKKSKIQKSQKITKQENPPSTDIKEGNKWGIALLGAIIVIGLYYYLTTLIPIRNEGFDSANTPSSFNAQSPQNTTGVPVDADSFLNGL